MPANWSTALSREVYAIEHWGEGYFDINDDGQVIVTPSRNPDHGKVVLPEIVDAIRREGLTLPVLVRFTDVLKDRVARLTEAFAKAREEHDYQAGTRRSIPSRSTSNAASSTHCSKTGVIQLDLKLEANLNFWPSCSFRRRNSNLQRVQGSLIHQTRSNWPLPGPQYLHRCRKTLRTERRSL